MKKIVRVSDSLTFTKLCCDKEHFDQHIKGKDLNVISENKTLYLVEDATGNQHTLYKTDVQQTVVSGRKALRKEDLHA